jgi:prostaglandin reductase 3
MAAAAAGDGSGASVTHHPTPTFTLPPDFRPPPTFRRLLGTCVPAPDFRSAAEVVEVPWVDPGPGEVAVRVAWAGVNGGCETFRVRAEAGTPFAAGSSAAAPVLLGAEGVGVVAAVGRGVTSLSVGDAVAVSGAHAFSECVIAPAAQCARLAGVGGPTPAACALALSGVTAAVALDTCGVGGPDGSPPLSADDAVLVTAAAGGTGHLAAQLAAGAGAAVFATAGGPAKAAALRDLLSPWAPRVRVIDYTTEDVGSVLSTECPQGLSVVYEGVGGALRATAAAALAPGGRLLAVGHISEYPNASTARPESVRAATGGGETPSPALPPAHDAFWGGRTVDLGGGRTLYGNIWSGADARAIARARRRVFGLHAEGKLRVLIDQPIGVGLGAAAGAVERLMSGASVGKVVLQVWE